MLVRLDLTPCQGVNIMQLSVSNVDQEIKIDGAFHCKIFLNHFMHDFGIAVFIVMDEVGAVSKYVFVLSYASDSLIRLDCSNVLPVYLGLILA